MNDYSIPGYDGWKLATPWDDEKSITVSFSCHKCEEWNESIEVTVGKSMEWETECSECGATNSGDESE